MPCVYRPFRFFARSLCRIGNRDFDHDLNLRVFLCIGGNDCCAGLNGGDDAGFINRNQDFITAAVDPGERIGVVGNRLDLNLPALAAAQRQTLRRIFNAGDRNAARLNIAARDFIEAVSHAPNFILNKLSVRVSGMCRTAVLINLHLWTLERLDQLSDGGAGFTG